MVRYFIPLILLIQAPLSMAYEQAFKQTRSGVTELKVLPAGRMLESKSDGSYFDESNGLFRPLFNYIQKNDISMTTPVEARPDPGAMYFWVSSEQVDRAQEDNQNVKVIDVPERTVVARGGRGAYSQANFVKSKMALMEWVEKNPSLEVVGEPFAVYWDGPFTPWFMKEYEVQVEVRVIESRAPELSSN